MNIQQLRTAIRDPRSPESAGFEEHRERAASVAREPVGRLSGAPLNEEEKKRVTAMLDEIDRGAATHRDQRSNVAIGKAVFEAHKQQNLALENGRDASGKTALDVGLQAGAKEARVQYQVREIELSKLSKEDRAQIEALMPEKPKVSSYVDELLAMSIQKRLQETNWEKAQENLPKGSVPIIEEQLQKDLDRLARTQPERTTEIWVKNTPEGTPLPATLDPEYRRQMAALKDVSATLNATTVRPLEPVVNEVEAVKVKAQEKDLSASVSKDKEAPNQLQNIDVLNELQAKPKPQEPVVPKDVEASYIRVGTKYHYQGKPELQAFEDKGNKLETHSNSEKVSSDLVRVAEARGWEELRVKGSEEFRQKVWLEASVRGIKVEGYKPTEIDRAQLEKARGERESNQIEKVERERQANAVRTKDSKSMVTDHPELAGAAGAIRHAELIAKRDLKTPGEQEKFMKMMREALATHISKGGQLPQVEIQERTTVRESSQEASR